ARGGAGRWGGGLFWTPCWRRRCGDDGCRRRRGARLAIWTAASRSRGNLARRPKLGLPGRGTGRNGGSLFSFLNRRRRRGRRRRYKRQRVIALKIYLVFIQSLDLLRHDLIDPFA